MPAADHHGLGRFNDAQDFSGKRLAEFAQVAAAERAQLIQAMLAALAPHVPALAVADLIINPSDAEAPESVEAILAGVLA